MEQINIPEWDDYGFLINPTEGWIDMEKTPF